MAKAVLILSGGLDSTTLMYDLLNKGIEVHAISFFYGQKHSKELECAHALCDKLNVPHKIIDLEVLNDLAPCALTRSEIEVPEGQYDSDNMKATAVPNRNMIMLALATAYAISIGANYVAYGAHAGDHTIYPDCRPKFVKHMTDAIASCDWSKVELLVPYLYMTKGEIVKVGLSLGVDYSDTWTCYKGGDKACGKCGSCIERLEAFAFANAVDPIEYETTEEETTEEESE